MNKIVLDFKVFRLVSFKTFKPTKAELLDRSADFRLMFPQR
jgi:hypothetical protein